MQCVLENEDGEEKGRAADHGRHLSRRQALLIKRDGDLTLVMLTAMTMHDGDCGR